jgi:hypothetical protein
MQDMIREAGLECADIPGKIDEIATLANAQGWAKESEQFIFCIDLLEMSAHDDQADSAVNRLEDRFEKLLSEA